MTRYTIDTDAMTIVEVEPSPPPLPPPPLSLEDALDQSFGGMFDDLRRSMSGPGYGREMNPRSPDMAITLHHSATGHRTLWADIAEYHVANRGWPGIGYHFGINALGVVAYLGDVHTVRYHTGDTNNKRIGVCLLGQYHEDAEGYNGPPPSAQVDAFRELVRVLGDYYGRTYRVVLHRHERPTVCPGDDLAHLATVEPVTVDIPPPRGGLSRGEQLADEWLAEPRDVSPYRRIETVGPYRAAFETGLGDRPEPGKAASMIRQGIAGLTGWRTGILAAALVVVGVAQVLGWEPPGEDSQRLIDFLTQPATVGLVVALLRDVTTGVAGWRKAHESEAADDDS